MGLPQVIVFVFFGEKYLEQFEICLQSIPYNWNVKVITDVPFESDTVECILVHTPETVCDMLAFRKNIPDYVNIDEYSQVWYADPDMIFNGDILEKYKDAEKVMVSNEPYINIDNPHMRGGFTDEEVFDLMEEKAPAINGGLYCVPKDKYHFFEMYKKSCDHLQALHPEERSTDQHALNYVCHKQVQYELFDDGDVGFPTKGDSGKLVNHFIGMGLHKLDLMREQLNKQV